MLSQAQTQAAADPLFRLWQEGRHLTALPQDLRPGTRAEGYAIQALLESRTAQPLFGWKIAATKVRCPRVRDRGEASGGDKIRCTSAIPPRYLRRSNVVHDGEVGPRSFGRYFSTVDFAISIPSF